MPITACFGRFALLRLLLLILVAPVSVVFLLRGGRLMGLRRST